MKTASQLYAALRRFQDAYAAALRPLCERTGMAQVAVDILLFLANNPKCDTARDIVEVRHLKANLVSIHLDRLEAEGYITRASVQGDRRKRALRLTEKAAPIITAGRKLQRDFFARLEENVNDADKAALLRALETMNQNMDKLLEERN